MKLSFMPSRTGTPIAFAYARHSTKEQASGDSRRRQQAKAEEWAEKNGYEVRHIYDNGRSAYSGGNRTLGQFGTFLAALKAGELGKAPVLLVENLDRVSREELEVAQGLFLEIISTGATLVTTHNGKAYKRPLQLTDVIIALLEIEAAHNYSAKLSERVKAAYDSRVKSGAIAHSQSSSPGWLKLNKERTAWTVNEKRARTIRWMYTEAIAGRGAESIARALNARGEAPWSRAKNWLGSAIDELLKTRATLGEYRGRSGYFPPVVTAESWKAVNDRVLRKARGRGAGEIKELNLLRGLCTSAIDGSPMILRQSGNKNRAGKYVWYHYLVSTDSIAGLTKPEHRIPYRRVEERVLWLATNINKKMLAAASKRVDSSHDDRLVQYENELGKAQKTLARLIKIAAEDDNPPAAISKRIRLAEDEIGQANRRLADIRRATPKTLDPLKKDDVSTPEARRALRAQLAAFCDGIIVGRTHILVKFGENLRDGLIMELEGELCAYPAEQIDADINIEETL